jgi:hypothetical protein
MAIGGRAAAVGAEFDVRDQIIAFKRKLAPRREAPKSPPSAWSPSFCFVFSAVRVLARSK